MRRIYIVAVIYCLTGVGPMHAQIAPLSLTLPEAIYAWLDASHRLVEMMAREDAARAAEGYRRESATRPQLSLMASYTRTNHVEELFEWLGSGGVQVIYPDVPDNVRSRVDLQWPIYTGGRLPGTDTGCRRRGECLQPGSPSRSSRPQT